MGNQAAAALQVLFVELRRDKVVENRELYNAPKNEPAPGCAILGRGPHQVGRYVGPLSRRPSTRTTVSLARWPIVMAKNVSVDQTKANQERELRKLASQWDAKSSMFTRITASPSSRARRDRSLHKQKPKRV